MFRIQVAADCARNYFISKVKRDVAKVQDAHAVTQMLLHVGRANFECK